MNPFPKSEPEKGKRRSLAESEILLLPDGRILVHNLTRATARMLEVIAPGSMASRLHQRRRADNLKNTQAL